MLASVLINVRRVLFNFNGYLKFELKPDPELILISESDLGEVEESPPPIKASQVMLVLTLYSSRTNKCQTHETFLFCIGSLDK